MEDLYEEGLIRAIGVSNFYPDRLTDICLFERKVIPAINQVETNPLNGQYEAQKNMEKNGVQIAAWAPFGEGMQGMFTNKTLVKIGEKYGVVIEALERDYCQPTDFNSEIYKKVEKQLHTNFPDVAVVPFLLTAGTDARRFTDVADNILRFAPIDLNKKQFATIHNANEHIAIKNIGECVVFYKDIVRVI